MNIALIKYYPLFNLSKCNNPIKKYEYIKLNNGLYEVYVYLKSKFVPEWANSNSIYCNANGCGYGGRLCLDQN